MTDAATIRTAHRDECRARKPFWIGGVPTKLGIYAVSKAVAARLKVTLADVNSALAEDGPIGASK